MDQESVASPKLSPASADLKKAISYSKHAANIVQEGSVAERVAQLQAKLSTPKQDPRATTTSSQSAVRLATENHSVSSSLLSSSNVPPQEAPILSSRIDNRIWHGDSFKHHPVVLKHASSAPRLQTPTRRNHAAKIWQGDSLHDHPLVRKQTTSFGSHQQHDQSASGQDTKHTAEEQSGSPTQSILTDVEKASIVSPQLVKSQKQSLNSLNQAPRLALENVRLQSPQVQLKSTPEPSKKTISPSSGGAYSRILPFTSSSYIPKRQSQNFNADETPSPRKLKSTFLADNVDENVSQTPLTLPKPPIFQSPRHENIRYQRRRTFKTKSNDALRRDGTNKTPDTSAAPPTRTPSDDVFITPTKTAKTYHVEPPFVAGSDSPVPPKNPHDIENPNYVPSVMPQHADDHRQLLRSRRARSKPGTSSQTHTSGEEISTASTSMLINKKDVLPHHVSSSTSPANKIKKTDTDNLSNYSSVISSNDWSHLQHFFNDDVGKVSTDQSEISNKVDTPQSEPIDTAIPMIDGTHSKTNTENDFDLA